ncbi:hypothetical protein, partial [Streptomyces sp. NPDC051776]|uniref:hypothetical protein n=1 Tax=Streptomyces sp. NPDC051776 TaxID=3155414 RepID=UPI00344009FC
MVNTEGKRPEKPVRWFRWKRPFLENSTACQKSTPDMLISRLRAMVVVWGLGSFEERHSEDAVDHWVIPLVV